MKKFENNNGNTYTNPSGYPEAPLDVPAAVKTKHYETATGLTKKLLPVAAFFMAFTTVMTILIVYMDNTAMRHYQFKVNMSQDYELFGISQDNAQLITYIREVHLSPAIEPNHRPLESEDIILQDTVYVLKLLKNKQGGSFVEAGAYSDGKTSRTEWLERKYNWYGLLVQPDPRHYFILRRHNRKRSQAVHACLSPTSYPKEVTLHQDADGVRVNSIHSDDDWFNTRVKCFPIYSLMLAMNVTNIDYFSLDTGGTELQVLETIPYDRVRIEVIGVHLTTNDSESNTIKEFLETKRYSFKQRFNSSYIFKLNRVKM